MDGICRRKSPERQILCCGTHSLNKTYRPRRYSQYCPFLTPMAGGLLPWYFYRIGQRVVGSERLHRTRGAIEQKRRYISSLIIIEEDVCVETVIVH